MNLNDSGQARMTTNWKFDIGNLRFDIPAAKQAGFTLVEILVGVAVGAIVALFLGSFLIQNNGIFSQQSAVVSQGISVNDAATEIANSIREAAAIENQYPQVSPQYYSNFNSLVVSLPSLNVSGDVIDDAYDYLVVSIDPTNPKILRKQIFPNNNPQSSRNAENRVLVTKLSAIKFYYLDSTNTVVSPTSASKINFVINLEENVTGGTKESSASGEISLRNN